MSQANNLGLRNSLFNLINKNELGSTDYSIAFYLLNHFNNFDSLNIYKMAEDCNVSRSSINRFIKELGYNNFLDFKNGFKDERYTEQKNKLIERPFPEYINLLTNEIFDMMDELKNRMNTEEVISLCQKINESNKVVFLSSSTNSGMVTYFQQEFILMDKLIYSISDSYTKDSFISSLTEDDYIITFSNSGRFALATLDVIMNTKCKTTLITTNREKAFLNFYDNIYYLSSKDIRDLDENIYNRYGITYMLDIILNTYAYLYSTKKESEEMK